MDLTQERKAEINSKTIRQLLSQWRFAPVGDPWFQGETGAYWENRMCELRDKDNDAYVSASKSLGLG
jgi:hypothetical protein